MTFTYSALAAVLAALLFDHCSARSPPVVRLRTSAERAEDDGSHQPIAFPYNVESRIRPVASQADVEYAVNKFSMDLFRTILPPGSRNAVVSPLGVALLLAVLQQGAAPGSDTAKQLESRLQLDKEASRRSLPPVLRNAITKSESKSTLEAGTRLFVNSGFRLSPTFRNVMERDFTAGIESLDFRQPDKAAAAVNKWVAQATHGHIPRIVEKDAITSYTHLMLASAMYFRGVWLRTFDAARTIPRQFSRSPSDDVMVPMMRQIGDFRTGELPQLGAQWIELPFDGQHFSMLLVLPTRRHGLDEVLKSFGPEHIKYMLTATARAGVHRVILTLPKFRLSNDISLSDTLQKLGVTAMFGRNASLTKIAENTEPLVVSDVIQKAEMKVDEQGSTASAATAVLVNTLSLVNFSEDVKFFADHPFLTLIVDRNSKIPLFMGRVSDPSQGL